MTLNIKMSNRAQQMETPKFKTHVKKPVNKMLANSTQYRQLHDDTATSYCNLHIYMLHKFTIIPQREINK